MSAAAQIVYPHISKDPDICSGRACIAGTRVRVMDIVSLHQNGSSPELIVREFPSLSSLADVYAALLYYADHQAEVEADFDEHEGAADAWERHAGRRQPTRP